MRILAHVALIYLLLGLESAVLMQLGLSFHAPDIAAIAVVFVALRADYFSGLLTVVLMGLLQDGFSMGAPVGMHVEVFVLIYLFARRVTGRLIVDTALVMMVVGFLVSASSQILVLLLTAVFDRSFAQFGQGLGGVLPNALVTMPFAPIVFALFSWVEGLLRRRHSRSVFFR